MSAEIALNNRVKAGRIARNWSQEELARRTGVSRTGISAIEMGRLVPSVAAALSIAEKFGCSVEEIFSIHQEAAAPRIWAWPPQREPTRYWCAEVDDQQLLYPVEQSPLGVIPFDGVLRENKFLDYPHFVPENTLVVACCDPAVGLLASQMARSNVFRLLPFQRSSGQALSLLGQGVIHVAGIHLGRATHADDNRRIVKKRLGCGYTMLRVAIWEEGVAIAPGLQLPSVQAVLSARLRWVGREPGSAARKRLDDLLANRKSPRRIAYDHRGVAQAIRCGWADAGVCHRLVAEEAGLDFLGVEKETYDLCWPSRFDNDSRIQALLGAVRSAHYRDSLADLPGIESRNAGELITVN